MKAVNFNAPNWAVCFAAMFALACCCAAFIVALDYFTGTRDLVYAVPLAGMAAMAATFSLAAWRMRKRRHVQPAVAGETKINKSFFGIFNRVMFRHQVPVNQNKSAQKGENKVADATETRALSANGDGNANAVANAVINETDAQSTANAPLRWHSISMSVTRPSANRVRSNS